jgi:hypothetical protein
MWAKMQQEKVSIIFSAKCTAFQRAKLHSWKLFDSRQNSSASSKNNSDSKRNIAF